MTSKTEQVNEIYKKVETEAGGYFIPAKGKEDIYSKNTRLRVCAYCRVSMDNDAQMSSFELQQEHYQNLVGSHPNWDSATRGFTWMKIYIMGEQLLKKQ